MTATLIITRLLLASVLAVSAVAKLADRAGSKSSLTAFGVPSAVAGPAATLLPPAELVIAAGLLGGVSARAAAIAMLVLLGTFSAAVVRALARGDEVACHCFGQLSTEPAGPGSLLRNGILAVLAVFVVAAPGAPGPGVAAWLGDLTAADRVAFWLGLVLACVLAAATWFGVELLRQHGRLLVRLDALEQGRPGRGPAVGSPAPAFALSGPDGAPLTLADLLAAGDPVVLTFSDAQCGACQELVPLVARAQRVWRDKVTIALLSAGATPESETAWAAHALRHVGVAPSRAVNLSYGAPSAPAAVLISSTGLIDGHVVAGLGPVAALLADPVGHGDAAVLSVVGRSRA